MPDTTVRHYMTLAPKSIDFERTLAEASEYMRKLHVKHLPVNKLGRTVGVITERDVTLALIFRDSGALKTRVDSVFNQEVLTTSPESDLKEVAREMAGSQMDCALVIEHGKLVGILTSIDAIRALVESLRLADVG